MDAGVGFAHAGGRCRGLQPAGRGADPPRSPHNDGTWGSLERRQEHHDPSAHDPEAGWAEGDLYVCTTCDEQVRVQYPAGGGAHPEAR